MRPGSNPSPDVTFRTRLNPGAINGAPAVAQHRALSFRPRLTVGGALMRPGSNPSPDVTFRTRLTPGAINGAPAKTRYRALSFHPRLNVGGALMRPGLNPSPGVIVSYPYAPRHKPPLNHRSH